MSEETRELTAEQFAEAERSMDREAERVATAPAAWTSELPTEPEFYLHRPAPTWYPELWELTKVGIWLQAQEAGDPPTGGQWLRIQVPA